MRNEIAGTDPTLSVRIINLSFSVSNRKALAALCSPCVLVYSPSTVGHPFTFPTLKLKLLTRTFEVVRYLTQMLFCFMRNIAEASAASGLACMCPRLPAPKNMKTPCNQCLSPFCPSTVSESLASQRTFLAGELKLSICCIGSREEM